MNKILFMILFLICNSFVALALTESELSNIATERFRSVVSIEYQNEFRLVTVERQETPRYLFIWQRFVNDIPMVEDRYGLFIYINGSLDIESYKFSVPASQLDTIPTLSKDQARWIAEKYYGNIKSISLKIIDKKLLYEMYLESGPIIGIDANTGNSQILAVPLGISIEAVQTSFNPTQFYLETYGPYIALIILILGGVLYWKFMLPKKK